MIDILDVEFAAQCYRNNGRRWWAVFAIVNGRAESFTAWTLC